MKKKENCHSKLKESQGYSALFHRFLGNVKHSFSANSFGKKVNQR